MIQIHLNSLWLGREGNRLIFTEEKSKNFKVSVTYHLVRLPCSTDEEKEVQRRVTCPG